MVPAKQGVYAIVNHDNLRQKASVCFVFFKDLRGNFLCGGKKKIKHSTRNCLYTGDPCERCAEFAPDKKS